MKYAYHGTRRVDLPKLAKSGLVAGAASGYSDNYSEFDDGNHLFFSDEADYLRGAYGDTIVRFPWPSDAKHDQNVYGRKLAHQFATKKNVSPAHIEVEVGRDWVPLKDATAQRVAARFRNRQAALPETTLPRVMAGMGMLMAQSVIVTSPSFGEKEIRKYLKLRMQFHDQFVEAIEDLAEAIEAGDFGNAAKTAVRPLQSIGSIPAKQAQRALRMATRAFRGLKKLNRNDIPDADPRIFRLIHMALRLDPSNVEQYRRPSGEYEDFLGGLLRIPELPPPVRTLFRKAIKNVKNLPTDTANAGAWFEMKPETKNKLRDLYVESEADQERIYEKFKDDPEKLQEAFKELTRKQNKLVNVAGVNKDILSKGFQEPKESLDNVLGRESKLQADGPTEFVLSRIKGALMQTAKERGKGKGVPRDLGKVITQVNKARTFDTVKRVIREAVERKVLYPDFNALADTVTARAGKNLAVKKGGTLTPLQWEPVTPEEFQEKHSTGPVIFDPDTPDKDRDEMLGRVSRAVTDLEGIFGKGFAGKHAKKLKFEFTGAGFGAAASYFGWDDRNEWQPRVRFGEDFEGLLAHELSHFFDDMLSHKIQKAQYPDHRNTPGVSELFGSTGVDLEYIAGRTSTSSKYLERFREGPVPELADFVTAVVDSEDFERWKDMTGSAHETGIGKAIKKLTGKDSYELPDDHPYKKIYQDMPRLKSDWPPELLMATEDAYVESMGGDSRKLTYFNSGVEVWARMVEQYVYTKLADAGIANPWLTQLTYDLDELPQMMDQETFEKKLVPIFDRIFARIKERELVASRVAARYVEARAS